MLSLEHLRKLQSDPTEVIAVLRDLFTRMGEATTQVGGRLGFKVHGAQGGVWTVELSSPGGRWAEGDETAFARCDARIYCFQREFAALVAGPEAIGGLLETGRFVVEGRKQMLPRLGQLIRTTGGL